MTESNKMTRREWFRLRPQRTESENAGNRQDHLVGEESRALQPIEEPVNHDGMDLSELPPMREASLSEEEVRQLFSDIQALGEDILLMQRSARSQRASASRATTADQLRTALETLLSGAVPRVQIRYKWEDSNWIDTLERREADVRLIRIAHNPANRPGRASS